MGARIWPKRTLGPELTINITSIHHRRARPHRAFALWKQEAAPSRSEDVSIHVEGLRLSFTRKSEVREVRLPFTAARPFTTTAPLPLCLTLSPPSLLQVLKGVDLTVPRGTFHMLLGANGCGKSTLLRALAGLLPATADTSHLDAPYAFVFQNPDHQVVLPTVSSDVAFGLGRYDLDQAQVTAVVQHALERVNLGAYADRPASSLSGGQKQRVAIAGALAENPKVLLLDELTTFLDGKDQWNVLECVRGLVDAGNEAHSSAGDEAAFDNPVTALWVTHRLEELEFSDGVSYMEGGRVVWSTTPKEAIARMRKLGAVV